MKAATAPRLRVGVVGALDVRRPGVKIVQGALASLPPLPLVLVSSSSASVSEVAAVARRHPDTHYAIVGASAQAQRVPNLAGVVIGEVQAARIAGVVAGLVAAAGSDPVAPRVAWVGPEERPLATAARRGLRSVAPRATLLRQWTRNVPARCKEGALTAIGRGATVVVADGGLCAAAVLAAADEQDLVGMQLSDFELPSVAARWIVDQAVSGVYHGGDVVFGLESGALGVARLDPRIPPAVAIRVRSAVQALVGGLRP